jgi:uncharacterized protein YoxC
MTGRRRRTVFKALTVAFLIVAIALVVLAFADEAPIAGTVKTIDASANTLTLQTTAKGKTRDVTILLKPDSKIVKF